MTTSEEHSCETDLQPIEAITARLKAATPGPWWFDEDENVWRLHGVAARFDNPPFAETVVNKQILKAPKANTPYAEYWPDAADADFIAHAWADVTWLLQECDRLASALEVALTSPTKDTQ